MSFRRYQNTDWVGVWYEILKDRGENDLIAMIRGSRLDDGGVKDLQAHSFSHSKMDGTTSIPYFMTKFGQKSAPRNASSFKTPSLYQMIKLVFKNLKLSPENSPKWKIQRDVKIGDIYDYGRFVLSKDETSRVLKYCKEHRISENSLFLYYFNMEIIKLIDNPRQQLNWLFPVNVRGLVNKANPTQNQTSFIPLITNSKSSISDINLQLTTQLKSFSYLAIWWVHQIGVFIGKRGMRYLSRKSSKHAFWLGTFSNVGHWKTDKKLFKSVGLNEAWFFATPGSRNFPISMVIMTLDEQMSFSLRVHPCVRDCSCDEFGILKNMVKSLLLGIKANPLH